MTPIPPHLIAFITDSGWVVTIDGKHYNPLFYQPGPPDCDTDPILLPQNLTIQKLHHALALQADVLNFLVDEVERLKLENFSLRQSQKATLDT